MKKTNSIKEAHQDGAHKHGLARTVLKTSGSFRHSHTFLVPDGHLIETTVGGSHNHDIASLLANETELGGEHSHSVVIGKEKYATDRGGAHTHNLRAVSTEDQSGLHIHTFQFEGVILKSLTGSEIYAWKDEKASGLGLPLCDISDVSLAKCTDSQVLFLNKYLNDLYELNFADGSVEKGFLTKSLLLRGAHAVHKALEARSIVADTDTLSKEVVVAGPSVLRKYKGTFSSNSDGILFSLDNGDSWSILCKRDLCVDEPELTPHGSRDFLPITKNGCSAQKTESTLVTTGGVSTEVEVCFHSDEISEYYVSSGPFSGYLIFKSSVDGWSCYLNTSGVPYSLSKEATLSGKLPAHGTSGIPASLEQDIPFNYQFWKAATFEDAKKVRDSLYFSDLIDDSNIQKVDGHLRRLVKRYFLPQQDVVKGNVFPLEPRSVDESATIRSMFGSEPVDFDGGELTGDFFVKARNTEENIELFSAASRPFSVNKLSNDYVYCKATPVTCVSEITWHDAPVKGDKLVARILSGEHRVVKSGDVEERIVFGIVLEPDTVDSQNDIYNAKEVEKAAHIFMEEHRNIGLQHKAMVNDKVKILESYISPVDFTIEGQLVKQGTWLLKERILDDELWASIKSGDITGYSIGGTGVRTLKD